MPMHTPRGTGYIIFLACFVGLNYHLVEFSMWSFHDVVAQAAKSGSAATPTPPDKESPIRREEASSTVPDGDAKTEGGVRGSDRGYPGETERKRGRTREEERGERRELAAEEGPGEEEMEVVEGEGPKEARTAFVSNLTFTIDEEQIREKFSEVHVCACVCACVCVLL